ncbi:MAG: EF-hand domain-containing protein [Marinoscillum sp.]
MNKTLKTIALVAIASTMMSCASQNTQTTSQNQGNTRQQGGRQQPPSFAQLLSEMDTNKDGKLSKSEVKGPIANEFSTIDTNEDGYLSEQELENAPAPQRGRGPRH